MTYIRNFRGSSGNRAIISGSNVQVTGSLFASTVSGTTAQFTSITAALGSLTAPSYTFSEDTNTGIYSPAADTIVFVEGGTQVLRISPDASITASGDIYFSGFEKQIFAGVNGANTIPHYSFVQSESGTGLHSTATNQIDFLTSGSIRASFTANGDLLFANGKGISFANTTPDGTSPTTELLDDYEQGTWVPTISGSTTAGSYTYTTNARNGLYIKIGKLVYVTCVIVVSSTTLSAAGDVRIRGLPFQSFTTTGGTSYAGGLVCSTWSFSSSFYSVMGRVNSGVSYIELRALKSSLLNSVVAGTDLGTNPVIYLAGQYIAA